MVIRLTNIPVRKDWFHGIPPFNARHNVLGPTYWSVPTKVIKVTIYVTPAP